VRRRKASPRYSATPADGGALTGGGVCHSHEVSVERSPTLHDLDSLGLDPVRGSAGERERSKALEARFAVPAALLGIAAVSVVLRVLFATKVNGPYVFPDELGYERMAESLARTGHLAVFGKSGIVYSPLYPVFLAPIYALTSSAQVAYEWAKVENAVLMSLSVFPVYGIARFVLPRNRSLGVAALSLAAPLMFYNGLEMSENLAYPLFLVAVWAMLRAVRDPSVRNDALLVGSILLATAARLQLVVLFPAALFAILLVALLQPCSSGRRISAALAAVKSHRLLFGSVAALAAVVLVRTALNGGTLPLAGFYANVGRARANPVTVLEAAVYHLAELDFALGVIPFACALLAAYVLARSGFRRDGLLFGSVAVAVTGWVLLEVAFDAVAFPSRDGYPRIHERYLIYLVPFFLVALVATLRSTRPRVPTRAHLAFAATAALLPSVIPFSRFVNLSMNEASFGLQIFGRYTKGQIHPAAHATVVALIVGGILGLAYIYAFVRPRSSFAVVTTVVAFLILSDVAGVRIALAASATAGGEPLARTPWVDRAVGGTDDVAVVEGKGMSGPGLKNMLFENLSISRVYSACRSTLGTDLGEEPLTANGAGRLRDATGVVHARYAVVAPSLGIRGRVLHRSKKDGFVLIKPPGGVLTIRPDHRSALRCSN
jgi:hypothetical protein